MNENVEEKSSRRARQYAAVTCALVIGMIMLALSVPRVVAYASIALSSDVLAVLKKGESVERGNLLEALSAYAKALRWQSGDADLLLGHAQIVGRLAAVESSEEKRGLLAREMFDDVRAAAIAAPGKSLAWAQLARASIKQGSRPDEIVEFLKLSRLTGHQLASSMLVRFYLVSSQWTDMPGDVRAQAMDDFYALWQVKQFRHELVRQYIESSFSARQAMRNRLVLEPGALQMLDGVLHRMLKRTS